MLIDADQTGSIVNIASNCGKVGYPNMAGYNASKAAVINLTRSLSAELSGHNINVNAICPGCVYTPMFHGYTRDVDLARFIPEMMRNGEVIESPADVDFMTQKYTDETIGFIRNNHDKPFFIYLAHHMPHLPLGASSVFKGKSERGPYGDAVEELDWSMGEIFKELERLHLGGNTLVIYLSDNGPEVGHSEKYKGSAVPLRGEKYSNWEGGVRVPAIMRWPGKIPACPLLPLFPDTVAGSADRALETRLPQTGQFALHNVAWSLYRYGRKAHVV